MKRTLLRSIPAFKAYMEWYTLRDLVQPFIGERGLALFCYTISTGNRWHICSIFFRKIFVDWGEDPEALHLSEDEKLLADFGAVIVSNPRGIPKEINERLAARYAEDVRDDAAIVEAVGGGMMTELVLYLASDRARYATYSQFIQDAGLLTK